MQCRCVFKAEEDIHRLEGVPWPEDITYHDNQARTYYVLNVLNVHTPCCTCACASASACTRMCLPYLQSGTCSPVDEVPLTVPPAATSHTPVTHPLACTTCPTCQGCIDAMTKQPRGVFGLLDESCALKSAVEADWFRCVDSTFAAGAAGAGGGPRGREAWVVSAARFKLRDEEAFVVRHFAGDVCYISAAAQARAVGTPVGGGGSGSGSASVRQIVDVLNPYGETVPVAICIRACNRK